MAQHTETKKVHLIGIGGIGMSGLARMYLSRGYSVRGTDSQESEMTETLRRLGATVFIGHDSRYVEDADLVVYSSSISEDHCERRAAVQTGIPVIHRAEALAEICRGKHTVAITGTHGKTTTTALVGMILKEADRDPSIVVGGVVNFFGGNACSGQGPEIVIEADESDSSFLKFEPDVAVITNIEDDHIDHFKTLERVEEAYRGFIGRLKPNGEWFGCGEDRRLRLMAAEPLGRSTLYGFDSSRCKFYATQIQPRRDGVRGMSFRAWQGPECLGFVHLRIIGRHNVLNALASLAVGTRLGIPFEVIRKALEKFEGVGRRFDVKYEDERFLVVDDYAHHPTEIKETLAAARELNKKRIVALFQPHRYTRTEALLDEFGKSFFAADKLIVTDIYSASEAPRPGITGDRVFETIKNAGHRDVTFVNRMNVTEFVKGQMRPGDLVIAMGAGDIYRVAGELSEFLRLESVPAIPKKVVEDAPFGDLRGKWMTSELLSKHTSLRIGGPVDFWVEPQDEGDLRRVLRACREAAWPIYLFGAGTNILAPDEGLRGVGIYLGAPYFRELRLEGEYLVARAGVPNSVFIQKAVENGFGGCEFLQGIPGSVGGSLVMNAGSHGQSIGALFEYARLIDWEGVERILAKNEIRFDYRKSDIGGGVLVEVAFSLPRRDRGLTQKKLDEYREYRARTQDLQAASAGCIFKNPINNDRSSAQLIEQARLKGRTVGQAQVSWKHANFIVNLGGATAGDVMTLINEVQHTVKREFDVELEPEVIILGERVTA